MTLILQLVAIAALLALTVFIVLSDTGGHGGAHRRGARSASKAATSKAAPKPDDEPASAPSSLSAPTPITVATPEPVAPLPAPMGSAVIHAAMRRREIGRPALEPDPDRLIQTEVLEATGPAVRIGALLRLLFWLLMAGLGIGLVILGGVRGIALFFENLLGV